MTSREITGVALKCLAIYLLFSALVVTPMGIVFADRSVQNIGRESIAWPIVVGLGICLVMVVFGYLTWKIGKSLATTFEDTPTDELKCEISPSALEGMLFRVLGIYFIIDNIRPFVLNLVMHQAWLDGDYDMTIPVIEDIATLAIIIFGLFLVAKPRAWVSLLGKLRRADIQPAGEQESTEPAPHNGQPSPEADANDRADRP